MKLTQYDLLTAQWIPAMDEHGKVQEYGILELLERAPELTALADPAPPFQFGLYRFLTAFLMDALALRSTDDLVDLLEAESFPLERIVAYVDQVGRSRFDLFDSHTPFMQVPVSALPPSASPEPMARLIQHLPSGTNPIHFHHVRADQHALSPAVCARALLALSPFATAGGAGYSPSVNGAPPWYVLTMGSSLFETLLLNCFVLPLPGLTGNQAPAWRDDRPLQAKEERGPESILEGLTWRPRLVSLIPGEGGICTYSGKQEPVLVRQMFFGPGLKAGAAPNWTDPAVAYKYTEKGRLPIRPQEERQLWRDTGPLLLLRSDQYVSAEGKVRFDRPEVIRQFQYLQEEGVVPFDRPLLVEAFGIRSDKAKLFEWQYERLALPAGLNGKPLAGPFVQGCLEKAESVAYHLGKALKKAYPRDGEGNKAAFDRLIQGAGSRFWVQLESVFKEDLLESIAGWDGYDSVVQRRIAEEWSRVVRRHGWESLEAVLRDLDADAAALERQVEARGFFEGAVARIFDPRPAQSKRKGGKRV